MTRKKNSLPTVPKWAPKWLVDFIVWKHSVPLFCVVLSMPIFYGAATAVALEQCLGLIFCGFLLLLLGAANAMVEHNRIDYTPGHRFGRWNEEKKRWER